MAFHQLLCGFTVMIILSSKGCQSQQPSCGQPRSNTSNVGGQDAPPEILPWIITIHDATTVLCGGSLITDQWVLTAASCIIGLNLNVDQTVFHPSFNFSTGENDIALLKLLAPVNFTDRFYPVCLPSANSTLPPGTNSWTAEWFVNLTASTFRTTNVNVQTVGNNECERYHPEITKNMLCAGVNNTCAGLGGAPLVTRDGPVWVQTGIHSFPRFCFQSPNTPAVYTRVSQYLDWISNITSRSEPPPTSPAPPPATSTLTPTQIDITDKDGSVFASGENLIHSSHFTHCFSLCVLVLSLFVLVADA